ncbi:MAG: sulfotransferase [Phycisphaerales bacterium]
MGHDARVRTSTAVVWLFSLARSGSSITAYAGAHAAGAAVADEVLGPWDRTGEPYGYPPEQVELVEAFKHAHAHLTPEIAERTQALLEQLAAREGTSRIVSKHPHLRFTPDELAERFPTHRAVYLIRNPLKRLASIYARGWTSIIRPNDDIDYFREYAERWLSRPPEERLVFEDLHRDPHGYFARLLSAWGWPADAEAVDRAVVYQRAKYHGLSGEIESNRRPGRSLSDRSRTTPRDTVDRYLADPFMRDLFERCGWSLRRADYLPTAPQRARRWMAACKRRVLGSGSTPSPGP